MGQPAAVVSLCIAGAWQYTGVSKPYDDHGVGEVAVFVFFGPSPSCCHLRAELLGGNEILLEHNVGRFVANAEAICSYEGTWEMNTRIVGRAISGQSAFV